MIRYYHMRFQDYVPRCPYCRGIDSYWSCFEGVHIKTCQECGQTFHYRAFPITQYHVWPIIEFPPTRSRSSVLTEPVRFGSNSRHNWNRWISKRIMKKIANEFKPQEKMNEQDLYWWGIEK